MSSPRTSLYSVLRLRPVLEGAGELGISSVPESRGKLGIFPSPRAYMEETGCIRRSRKLGIFPSPRAYIGGQRSEFCPRVYIEGE